MFSTPWSTRRKIAGSEFLLRFPASAIALELSQPGGSSILDDLQLGPFEALERFRCVGGVSDNHGNQGVRVDLPVQSVVQGIEIDPGETVGKVDVMVWRQAVDEEIGVPVHQGPGGLELVGLALDQGAPRVVQLGLGGWPAAAQCQELAVDIIQSVGKLVGLDGRGDRERAAAQATVEVAEHPVCVSSLLAE